jgi:perosamine synthetase
MKSDEKLALHGGSPVRERPFPPWPDYGEEEIAAANSVLLSGKLARQSGTKVNEFEQAYARAFGVEHAIACSNGTAAVHIALSALGIGPGDEVINTSHCFIGTATPVVHAGAVPVFADIDTRTFNIDPVSIEEKITPLTRAIVPAHMNGLPADMDAIMAIAKKHDLHVVEDAAQAHSATYKGKKAGTIGTIGCFSFWEDKLMTTAGEGGMVIIDDNDLYQRAKMFHHHGELKEDGGYYKGERLYHHSMLGFNFRMTEIQAAIGIVQLSRLDEFVAARRRWAHLLTEGLSEIEGIIPPFEPEESKHVFYKYIIKLDRNEINVPIKEFIDALAAEGIPCSRRYPTPLHQQPVFVEHRGFGNTQFPFSGPHYSGETNYGSGLPNAEQLPNDLVRLLMRPTLTESDIEDVVRGVRKITRYYRSTASHKETSGGIH